MKLHDQQKFEFSDERRNRESISNINKLEDYACQCHRQCSIINNISREVDGRKLAATVGLSINTITLPAVVRGYLDTEQKTIYLNKHLLNERLINETIIHECSHHILNHKLPTPTNEPYSPYNQSKDEAYKREIELNQIEFEAKYLTSMIMLPTDLLLKALEDFPCSISKIEREFNVSPTQVMRRLNQILFQEKSIPTHWIKSSGLRFIKHEIYDGYKAPSENHGVTEKYKALFLAPTYARRYGPKSVRFAFEEKIDGEKFVTYVFVRATHFDSVCSAFGVPLQFAKNFRFYHKMKEYGPTMAPDEKQSRTFLGRVLNWPKSLVQKRSSKRLMTRALMSVSGLLIVAAFTQYGMPLRGFELGIALIIALLPAALALIINGNKN